MKFNPVTRETPHVVDLPPGTDATIVVQQPAPSQQRVPVLRSWLVKDGCAHRLVPPRHPIRNKAQVIQHLGAHRGVRGGGGVRLLAKAQSAAPRRSGSTTAPKDNIRTGDNAKSQLDQFSRYEFGFSGVRCTILGCFYQDNAGKLRFGADLENFYSAHNYSVIKPNDELLRVIVNYRDSGVPGAQGDIRIGKVRYSSSQRFIDHQKEVVVFVKSEDFAGKRSGLFGMTRTGKSNSIKKIIEANEQMSAKAALKLDSSKESADEILKPFADHGTPKYPIGQIIFDMNGEYANANLQDAGCHSSKIHPAVESLW